MFYHNSFYDQGTGKIPFRSFVAVSNKGCTDGVNGNKQWGGDISGGGIGFGIGKTCDSARKDFCNRYGKVCKNGVKVCYGETCPGENSGGSGNTYKGLQDAGFKIAKTNPKTGVTVLDGGNNGSGGNDDKTCQPFDIPCLLKGLNLPPVIPGIPTEYLLIGGIGAIVLFMVIR